MGNATLTGGVWTHNGSACIEGFPSCYAPVGGSGAAGAIRRLNPADGGLVSVGGRPFESALPSNPLAPCTLNGNSILVCAGGENPSTGHNRGLFVVDTTKAASILRHLEDIVNVRRVRPTGAGTRSDPQCQRRRTRQVGSVTTGAARTDPTTG